MGTQNQELVSLVDLMLGVLGVALDAEKDGKIDLMDLPLLLKIIPSLGPTLSGIGSIPAELSHLSAEDAGALVSHVMAKLSIGDAKAATVINAGLKCAISVLDLVKAIKA